MGKERLTLKLKNMFFIGGFIGHDYHSNNVTFVTDYYQININHVNQINVSLLNRKVYSSTWKIVNFRQSTRGGGYHVFDVDESALMKREIT